jgi:hypothetical protein
MVVHTVCLAHRSRSSRVRRDGHIISYCILHYGRAFPTHTFRIIFTTTFSSRHAPWLHLTYCLCLIILTSISLFTAKRLLFGAGHGTVFHLGMQEVSAFSSQDTFWCLQFCFHIGWVVGSMIVYPLHRFARTSRVSIAYCDTGFSRLATCFLCIYQLAAAKVTTVVK